MKTRKYLIIGAGPAGLQMGYFLQKAGLDYLIIEKNNRPGSFFAKYPIHRKLISINKKYNYFEEEQFNMRHDWNSLLSNDKELRLTQYTDELFPSADTLYQYLNDYAEKLKLNIEYSTEVDSISKNENGQFQIHTKDNSLFEASVLFVGTGAVSPNVPNDIEGIEHTINYGDASLDLEKYKNKRVCVLGGGNSGFETADYLSGVAAQVHVFVKEPVKFAWESHFVGDLRAVNNSLLDMYQLKSLHAVLNPRIKKIEKLADGTLQTQHEYDYPNSPVPGTLKLTRQYDYIFNCTGFNYTNQELFDETIQPQIQNNGKFYEMSDVWESTNVSNLYFIGTNMQGIDRQSASGFIHGFRYNIRTLSYLLQKFYEDRPYPFETVSIDPIENFLEKLYQRFSITDALFQLFGFLGDMLIYDEKERAMKWYEELPVEYIKRVRPTDQHVFMLTMEFGFHKHNKPSIEFLGPSDPNETEKAAFLHPIIRYYYQDQMDEFHFGDSLLARWDLPHASGGAIGSYHLEFYKWLASIIEFESPVLNMEGENPNYEQWDKE